MPGLNIGITKEELQAYKDSQKYGEMSLKDWILQQRHVTDYQPIQSITLDNLDLRGKDLSFVDFIGVTISECQIDDATRFAGASFKNATILKTPLGNATDLGYSTIVGIHIDDESTKSINNDNLFRQMSSLANTIMQFRSSILKDNNDLEKEIGALKDPFEANLTAAFLGARTHHKPHPHSGTKTALEKKIFAQIIPIPIAK